MVDFVEVGVLAVFFLGLTVASIQIQNRALNASVKKQQVTKLLESLGVKNFKPGDLNTDKLDDTGFGRLIALIREVKGAGTDPITQLFQLGQMQSMMRSPAGSPAAATPMFSTPPAQQTTGQ